MSLLLSRCSCKEAKYDRIERSLWMRFFPARRLFQCEICHAKIFAIQSEIDSMNWHMATGKFLASTAKTKQS